MTTMQNGTIRMMATGYLEEHYELLQKNINKLVYPVPEKRHLDMREINRLRIMCTNACMIYDELEARRLLEKK